MKNVLLMFAFIATLLVGSIGTAGAQVNYTVYDGTGTSSQVPVYGLYCDAYLKCEYVIPADHLTAINGSTISALKFYSSAASTEWEGVNFRVFLKEVASTTISAYSGYADATQVYMGALSISGNEMVVNFTTNYTYNGGNLLIGFYNETIGDYAGASFYGQTIQNSCVQGYSYSSLSGVTTNQRNFIPKTTFTVDELHGCLTPTNLEVTNVNPTGATVTWTPGNAETSWVVKFNDDEYPVSGTPSYTVTGLTPETDYVASVKAVCGDTEESEYTTPGVLFTTLPTCPAPTGVTVSNITSTSADIAWTHGGTANEWTIMLDSTEISATTNPYSLTGLDAATSYTVKVKANCSDDDESDWSATSTFTTECETFMVTETTPYFQGFDSTAFPPTCWSRNHTAGTSTNTWIRTTSSTYVHQGAGAAQLQDQNVGNRNDLVTSLLNIPAANTYQVDFWMYRSTYSYSLKPNEGVKVWVNTTPDTVGATEIMYIHREYTLDPAESATGWYEYSAIIPTSGDMYVIFQGISEYGTASYIDDITVNKAPTCLKPIDVTVSNITETTAEISWTEQGTTNEWTIMLDSTEISATTNPFTLTNLTNSTLYTVKVKANCSDDDESDWSTEVSFRTECGTIVVTDENPFLEGFEGPDFGCWTTEQVAGTANWELSTSYASEGNKSAKFPWTTNAEGRLISPILDLTQLTNSFVKFGHYQPAYNGAADELHLYYRASASDDWTLLQSFTTPTTGFAEEEIALPNPSATYQICFHGKGLDKLAIYVDNVFVGTYIPCLTPTAVVVSNETETSADVDWTAGNQETAWNIRYRPVSNSVFFDFEDGLQGWTAYDVDGDTYNWMHEDCAETPHMTPYEGTGCAYSESYSNDDYLPLTPDNWLISPEVELIGSVKFMAVGQDASYAAEHFAVYVIEGALPATIDSTTISAFTQVGTEQIATGEYTEYTFDLSGHTGMGYVAIRHFNCTNQFVFVIDNVTIGEETAEWTVVEGVTNPYTITGLTANTTYEVQVQAACSEDDASDWTVSVEFTTLGETPVVDTCEVPANIAVAHNVVTWESEAANFNIMIVANDTTTVQVAGNTYTVEGLEEGTVVTVMVQAICDENNVSDWSEATEFTFEGVGINNYGLNANVYPNPTRDVVNVECSAIGANLSVYDMFGKVVMNTTIQSERTELNLSNVAPGVYMIRIANNNAITTVKVVKE